jgi:hypothetical protein
VTVYSGDIGNTSDQRAMGGKGFLFTQPCLTAKRDG